MCEGIWQIKNIKSDLSQYLLLPNFSGWLLTARRSHTVLIMCLVILFFSYAICRKVGVRWKQKAFGFSFILPALLKHFRNIEEFGAKNILQTIKQLMQFGCCLKGRFLRSILFLNKWQLSWISQKPVDKCNHLFISILKQTLSGLQKPAKSNMAISEQMAHAAIFYFG